MHQSRHRSLTGLGIDVEEALRVPAADLVAQSVAGAGVRVVRVDLDDGDVFGGIFHHRGIVNGFGGVRGIVVDVLHLDVDLHEGGEGHHAAVAGVHRQPVVTNRFMVQQLQGSNHTYTRWRRKKNASVRRSFHLLNPAFQIHFTSKMFINYIYS